jgi:hypothetical protein
MTSPHRRGRIHPVFALLLALAGVMIGFVVFVAISGALRI